MPYLRSEPPWFAFLIHPRDIEDLYRWKGSKLLRDYSSGDEDFLRKATTLEPTVIGEVLFGFGGPRGELVGVMRMPDQVLGPGGQRAVEEAVKLAADRGAKVVGLGALTAPATGAGRTLMRRLPAGLTVTTGNAYTAAVASRNVLAAAEALGLSRPARVAVLGATGSVGMPTSRLLVQAGFEVTLIGRTLGRLRATLGDLAGHAAFSESLADLKGADIVLILTSASSARVSVEHVTSGTIIIDVSQPMNIPEGMYPAFRERGVLVTPGGLVRIPGYRSTYDFALRDPNATFACLAETYLMAREGVRQHSVGPIPLETVQRMVRLAERNGVVPSPLELPASVAPAAPVPAEFVTTTPREG